MRRLRIYLKQIPQHGCNMTYTNRKTSKLIQLSFLITIILLLVLPTSVMAHVRWTIDSVTPPRNNSTGLKTNPCGGISRTDRSTIFSAGQTIELEFEETINHPGHYRIAFSPAGDLNFDSYVLVDNIPDITNNGPYTQEVTIPMQICSECTLQLIQVMTTNINPQPSDFYYSCSDIEITNPGDTTAPLPVNGVMSQRGNSQVSLNWANPTTDFYQTIILKDTNPIVNTPSNGVLYTAGDMINGAEVVYVGKNSSFTATSLTNETQYYFKIFSLNPRKNYAGGVEINATPTSMGGAGSSSPTPAPANTGGGGSINILFLFGLLLIRQITSRFSISRG